MSKILELLGITPGPQSIDYVANKQQFHLFNLLTEQRHPRTWHLSSTIQEDVEAGLRALLSVDEDITGKLAELARDTSKLEQAVQAVAEALKLGRRIYVYGCGATGRLAKQMESTFWRPYWAGLRQRPLWPLLQNRLPANVEELLVGEMTGADRALVSSLEGFEDLPLIGRLQLEDHGIQKGDVVICVTEGGETSSVIGTVLAALDQYGPLDTPARAEAAKRLYFVYNNPDDVLRPFHRSASVIDNPAITKINLTTGPQAITGSTRLQATTSETFVVAMILEEAIGRVVAELLDPAQAVQLGFESRSTAARLGDFASVKNAVDAAVSAMARFTELEADTYRRGRFATYFAKTALITVFIDNTERSPTFRLFPLDRVDDGQRQCWTQVWTEAENAHEAWRTFLGRPFKGLDPSLYREPFEKLVEDPYLREAALRSLQNAGNDQELLYDFSFADRNVDRRGPSAGDLGVLVLVDDEVSELHNPDSAARRFLELFHGKGANVAILVATGPALAGHADALRTLLDPADTFVHVLLGDEADPLTLRRQIALKMMLNAHSTGIMAALGRVVGNTMTNVSPSNLKLVGRATYLVMSHVNDNVSEPVTFAEANAVVMDAIDYVRNEGIGQTAEVALSIIRIVESVRRGREIGWPQARRILDDKGLARFLEH
jgi:N-acetylmuramic acid 6-phosphate etherase